MSSSDSGISAASIQSSLVSVFRKLTSTVLPAEQLLEVLRFLARFDLDKASISCKVLLRLVLGNNDRLSRRPLNNAIITGEKRRALEPNDFKITLSATRECCGEPLPVMVTKFPLVDDENTIHFFFAFLKHSFVRRLDVSIRMTWTVLKCIRANVKDMVIEGLYTQCGSLKADLTRELLLNTFKMAGPDPVIRLLDSATTPIDQKYSSAQLTNDLLRDSLDKGIRGLYLPMNPPKNCASYRFDMAGIADFCLRSTADGGLRELECCAPTADAADIVQFLQNDTPISHRFVLSVNFFPSSTANNVLNHLQAHGFVFQRTPYGACSAFSGPTSMQVEFQGHTMKIRGGKEPEDGTEFFLDIE